MAYHFIFRERAFYFMRLRWWVFLSALVAVLSYGLLGYVVTRIWPAPNALVALPQLLLFTALFVALSATSLPVFAYLNYRFAKPGWLQRDRIRLLRQGVWVGFWGISLAYLQLARALTVLIALVLLIAFILIELFFLTRE